MEEFYKWLNISAVFEQENQSKFLTQYELKKRIEMLEHKITQSDSTDFDKCMLCGNTISVDLLFLHPDIEYCERCITLNSELQ